MRARWAAPGRTGARARRTPPAGAPGAGSGRRRTRAGRRRRTRPRARRRAATSAGPWPVESTDRCMQATASRAPAGSRRRASSIARRSGRRASSTASAASIAPGERTSTMFDPPSLEAIRSGFRSAAQRAQAAERVARGQRQRAVRAAARASAPSHRGGASWSSATSQSAAVEHRGELGPQRAVDLHVGGAALGQPQQPRAPGVQRRVGRVVAPVEQVPGDGTYDARVTRHFLTGEELTGAELTRPARPRRRAEGRPPGARRRWPGAASR